MRLMTLVSLLLLWPHAGHSAEAGFPLYEMTPDLEDKGSLQRGAKIYMNYCLGVPLSAISALQAYRRGFGCS